MTTRRVFHGGLLVLAASLAPLTGRGQTPPAARPADAPTVGPPIRRIATASALSTEQLGAVTGVLELRDGRVLVNDGTRRRLLLMDTTLTKVEVVLDSLAEIANTYGTRPGSLIQYKGDSALFIDPVSYAMIVLDPVAKIGRVRSVWRVQDLFLFTSPSGFYGYPGPVWGFCVFFPLARPGVFCRPPGRGRRGAPSSPAPPPRRPPPGAPPPPAFRTSRRTPTPRSSSRWTSIRESSTRWARSAFRK